MFERHIQSLNVTFFKRYIQSLNSTFRIKILHSEFKATQFSCFPVNVLLSLTFKLCIIRTYAHTSTHTAEPGAVLWLGGYCVTQGTGSVVHCCITFEKLQVWSCQDRVQQKIRSMKNFTVAERDNYELKKVANVINNKNKPPQDMLLV